MKCNHEDDKDKNTRSTPAILHIDKICGLGLIM